MHSLDFYAFNCLIFLSSRQPTSDAALPPRRRTDQLHQALTASTGKLHTFYRFSYINRVQSANLGKPSLERLLQN